MTLCGYCLVFSLRFEVEFLRRYSSLVHLVDRDTNEIPGLDKGLDCSAFILNAHIYAPVL